MTRSLQCRVLSFCRLRHGVLSRGVHIVELLGILVTYIRIDVKHFRVIEDIGKLTLRGFGVTFKLKTNICAAGYMLIVLFAADFVSHLHSE